MANKQKYDYVTASQGRVFIGGVLVDECYDIQYTYQESKEPIYGYNSKHFDAVLPGQVIIYGNFTINYKHDSYLNKVFQAIGNAGGTASSKTRRIENKAIANSYTETLKQFKAKQNELTEKKKEIAQAKLYKQDMDAQFEIEQEKESALSSDYEAKISNATIARDAFTSALTEEQKSILAIKRNDFNKLLSGTDGAATLNADFLAKIQNINNKINSKESEYSALLEGNVNELNSLPDILNKESEIKALEEERDQITKTTSELLAGKNSQILATLDDEQLRLSIEHDLTLTGAIANNNAFDEADYSDSYKSTEEAATTAKQDLESAEASKKSLENELQKLKEELQKIKNKEKERAIDISAALEETFSDTQEAKRPEDFGPFSIFIEYDGMIHKVIERCYLTGHSHVVTNSGQNVKEFYNFLAGDVT